MTAFFDTDILVYAVTTDPKREVAARTLEGGGIASVQVLNEFVHVSRRKLRHDWSAIEMALTQFPILLSSVLPLDVERHDEARRLARDHGLSFCDALIVAAALSGGCTVLSSENLQAGRRCGPLTIVDPFTAAASASG